MLPSDVNAAPQPPPVQTNERLWQALWLVTLLLLPSSLYAIFVHAPVEARMGIAQKIFYFHVPSAYAMYIGFGAAAETSLIGTRMLVMLPLCLLIAWGAPSSAQLFGRHWNALDLRPEPTPVPPHRFPGFQLTPAWALATAAALVLCLCLIGDARRFVYVQF